MILAAGEGRRMLPLTLDTPKPLLQVAGKSLLEWQILKLRDAGFREIVINVSYLGEQIVEAFQARRDLGVQLAFSREEKPLETGGGIRRALPLLGNSPFVLVNADIWTEFNFAALQHRLAQSDLAHLVMVQNPPQHPDGDFSLSAGERVTELSAGQGATFSGISVINPRLLENIASDREKFPLRLALSDAIARNAVSGEMYCGVWNDVGTPERLDTLRRALANYT